MSTIEKYLTDIYNLAVKGTGANNQPTHMFVSQEVYDDMCSCTMAVSYNTEDGTMSINPAEKEKPMIFKSLTLEAVKSLKDRHVVIGRSVSDAK